MGLVFQLPDSIELDKPERLEQELERWNAALAARRTIPAPVREAVRGLVDLVLALPREERGRVDRDLIESLQEGAAGAAAALTMDDPAEARNRLRIRLEQLRQAFTAIAEGAPVREDQSGKVLARWLVRVLGVPQAEIAELVGTSPRTFQRWLSEVDPAEPRGRDKRRLSLIARLANNLRHALTGYGVVQWLQDPNPRLGGRPPAALLDEPDAIRELLLLSMDARSSSAT